MNTTSAAIARNTSACGFTSFNPNMPADMVPTSGATLASLPPDTGLAPPPPDTLTLTDVTPGAVDGCDAGENGDGGVTAGLDTGNTDGFTGTTDTGRGAGNVNVGADTPNVRCSGVNAVRGVNVVGAVYAMLPERYDIYRRRRFFDSMKIPTAAAPANTSGGTESPPTVAAVIPPD